MVLSGVCDCVQGRLDQYNIRLITDSNKVCSSHVEFTPFTPFLCFILLIIIFHTLKFSGNVFRTGSINS